MSFLSVKIYTEYIVAENKREYKIQMHEKSRFTIDQMQLYVPLLRYDIMGKHYVIFNL